MRLENGRVSSEVGRGTGVRLDIDTPFGRVEVESLDSARSAEVLDLINEFVSTVVTVTRHALGVFVGEGTAEGFDDGEGSEVLGSDELDAAALATLLFLDEVMDFGIDGVEGGIAPTAYWIHWISEKMEKLKGIGNGGKLVKTDREVFAALLIKECDEDMRVPLYPFSSLSFTIF